MSFGHLLQNISLGVGNPTRQIIIISEDLLRKFGFRPLNLTGEPVVKVRYGPLNLTGEPVAKVRYGPLNLTGEPGVKVRCGPLNLIREPVVKVGYQVHNLCLNTGDLTD